MDPFVVVAIVVAVLAIGVAVVLARQVSGLLGRVDTLESRAPVGEGDLADIRRATGAALSRVAVVRYDAFGDMGGRLSFSAALLDDNRDGLVITSIHGRGESRTYAKGVVDGESETTLTPEERQAVAAAGKGSPAA